MFWLVSPEVCLLPEFRNSPPAENFHSAECVSTLNGFFFLRETKGNVTFSHKNERLEKCSLPLSKIPLYNLHIFFVSGKLEACCCCFRLRRLPSPQQQQSYLDNRFHDVIRFVYEDGTKCSALEHGWNKTAGDSPFCPPDCVSKPVLYR